MAGKGSPRFNMSSSPKLRRFIPTPSATEKSFLLNAVGQKRVVVLQEDTWLKGLGAALLLRHHKRKN
ncbi:hypothetical protein Zm00014a_036214 [Zea mays]|uniref:Uncharacterized protein n=2 Tax=Zea mays TaxID=4577 RepID=A0A3L6E2K0_MAIZE|nr:hypothetical protein Zm00014a_036214 [Zea mays]PWZ15070.1 hypothetical protein Zm00014a_036214 [Zea mays]